MKKKAIKFLSIILLICMISSITLNLNSMHSFGIPQNNDDGGGGGIPLPPPPPGDGGGTGGGEPPPGDGGGTEEPVCPPHSYEGYEFDTTRHWRECSECGHLTGKTAHSIVSGSCKTCGYTPPVTTVPVIGVTLNKSAMTLSVGQTSQLTATVLPANATNKDVIWSSNRNAIATVAADGTVTAVGVGSATITAMSAVDNTKYATCFVTVTGVPVTGITLDKTAMTISIGAKQQLTATVLPSNATDKTISWSSNRKAIATVASDGTVTAVSLGSAVITAMSGTCACGLHYATCTVTVTAASVPVTGIKLNKTTLSMAKGNTDQLTASAIPTDELITNATWNSSNTSVVTVSGSGNVTAVGVGSAVITATNPQDGKTATCQVIVTDAVTVGIATQIFIVPQLYNFTVYAAGEFTGNCNSWVGVSNPSDTYNKVTASIQTGFNTTKLTGIFNEQGLKSGQIGTTKIIFYVIPSPVSTTTTVKFTN